MAIGNTLTGGLGNGTLTTTIPLVLLRGLHTSAEDPATTTACVMRAEAFAPGAAEGDVFETGAFRGEVFETGTAAGEGC